MSRRQPLEARQQLRAVRLAHRQPWAVDVGDLPVRFGEFDVAAGIARHADEFVGKSTRGEQLLEGLRIALAEKTGDGQLMTEVGQHLRDVEALAGSMHLQTFAAIDLAQAQRGQLRSEEHTSELQSLMRTSYAVFCLKQKNTAHN